MEEERRENETGGEKKTDGEGVVEERRWGEEH